MLCSLMRPPGFALRPGRSRKESVFVIILPVVNAYLRSNVVIAAVFPTVKPDKTIALHRACDDAAYQRSVFGGFIIVISK
ncbi:hypothetical protein DSJ_20615 [Pantoea stewartii subsp. stewartii DC283]|uniref:Uncharacterized protein n=1 Tax=Pantoea stewartii subsp. stewartii DC283 TaxID=660596 RepID=A0ABM6KB92_PANSE|nr:hypothetical protein DSJ_20615 [Pantoea stewartii subsp. stewartii DC283]